MPSSDELLAGARVLAVPMTTRFRGITTRETMLLRGPRGWAEFAPFPEYDDAVAARWLAAAVEAGWGEWPAPVRESVPVNATVPAVAAADVAGVLARFDGCTAVKVKVAEPGQSLADDVARVAEVRSVLGPHAELKVDANGAWPVDEARRALAALDRYDLAYAEQPCATVDELAELRRALAADHADVLVAADESIRRAEDPLLVRDRQAADVVVVKAAPLGGLARALRIVDECGLPAVVSSALETSVGLNAGVALAAALPELPFACGLGTAALLTTDVGDGSMLPRAGRIGLQRRDALVVDEDRLAEVAAPLERARWWRERLARCAAVLAG